LPIVNNDKYVFKASSRPLKLFLEVLIALLLTAVRRKKWRMWTFILNWQFSRELPTPVRASVSALNGSHTLGDGQIRAGIFKACFGLENGRFGENQPKTLVFISIRTHRRCFQRDKFSRSFLKTGR